MSDEATIIEVMMNPQGHLYITSGDIEVDRGTILFQYGPDPDPMKKIVAPIGYRLELEAVRRGKAVVFTIKRVRTNPANRSGP